MDTQQGQLMYGTGASCLSKKTRNSGMLRLMRGVWEFADTTTSGRPQ